MIEQRVCPSRQQQAARHRGEPGGGGAQGEQLLHRAGEGGGGKERGRAPQRVEEQQRAANIHVLRGTETEGEGS